MVTCGASGTISPTISKQTMPSPSLDPTTSIPTSFKVWTISTRNFGSIWIVERGMELFLKRSGRLGSGGGERPTGFIAINIGHGNDATGASILQNVNRIDRTTFLSWTEAAGKIVSLTCYDLSST